MIIFLSYFSLGSKEIIMEIYQTDPIRIFCIKGCISFIIVSIIMHSIILLLVLIIKWILNVQIAPKKIIVFFGLNSVLIIIEIMIVLIYKLSTRGYV